MALIPGIARSEEDPPKPSAAKKEAADLYTLPADADIPAVMEFIKKIQEFEPQSLQEAQVFQRKARVAMQDAARKLLTLEKDEKSETWLLAKSIETGSEIGTLVAASSEERKEYVASVAKLLAHPKAGEQQVGLAQEVTNRLRRLDDGPVLVDAYRTFGGALERSSDKQIATLGRAMLGGARLFELPGKSMKLSMNKVDGSKFNLADLKGKVVLVDFWATWCGPCVGEIPNMRAMYKQYHDQGFEIVGINLDEDRDDLDGFLEKRKLPWIIVRDDESPDQPAPAVEYGILKAIGIPTMILVGKDGKVIDVQARGERLEELLKKEFGGDEKKEK